jgi:methionyl-tRNA formyltransferase
VAEEHLTGASLRVVIFTVLPQVAAGFVEVFAAMGHRVVGVVTTPGPERRRSTGYLDVVRAVPPGIDIIVSTHPRRLAAMLTPLRPDLIMCMSFPLRIPQEVIDLPRLGTINGHPSKLPQYRGPNSVGWMIRNGDPELAFTFHRMDGDFDTGPILAQATAPLGEDDDLETILGKMQQIVFSIFPIALERVLRADPGDPQPNEGASEAPLFEPEWRAIDWAQPELTIHRQVRSWIGFTDYAAGALAEVQGEPFVILKTRRLPGETSDAPPGTVLRRDAQTGSFVIQCGDGPLEVLHFQPQPV